MNNRPFGGSSSETSCHPIFMNNNRILYIKILGKISGSHGDKHEDYSLLGYCAL
jgi:hypothetical protein